MLEKAPSAQLVVPKTSGSLVDAKFTKTEVPERVARTAGHQVEATPLPLAGGAIRRAFTAGTADGEIADHQVIGQVKGSAG